MSFWNGDCAVNKAILAGIFGLAFGAAAVAAFFVATPGNEEKQLREALIRLNESVGQGVNVKDFTALTIEARTKLRMADRKMRPSTAATAEQAVKTASVVATVWSETHTGRCADLFSQYYDSFFELRCKEQILAPMISLGLISGEDKFRDFLCGKTSCGREALISAAFAKVGQDLNPAIKSLD